MLSKEELKEISRITRLKLYQQEKHYIQTTILNSLYSLITNELIFKGGTALFLCYGLNRFSEDLDFTMIKEIDLKKTIDKISNDLEILGIRNKIGKIKESQISISFKIGVEGPLYNKEIERCYVSIDISKRELIEEYDIKEVKTLYNGILPFTLCIMKKEEILAEKIRALMSRNYARDLYDIYFLLKQGVKFNIKLIKNKLSYYNIILDKKEIIKKIDNQKEIWDPEMRNLLIGDIPKFEEIRKLIIEEVKKL